MASICNDERAPCGVMSGHDRKTLSLSGLAPASAFARADRLRASLGPMGSGYCPNASPTSCSRCMRCQGCFAASSWPRCKRRMRQETLPKTRKAPIPTGPIGTRRCTGTDWVVYAKTPMGGPAQVLEYLARYTHRTAIGNERIASVDADQVAFKVRADDAGAKRMLRLDGVQFVRRGSCCMCCPPGSSGFATTVCWRRARPAYWHRQDRHCACRSPTPRRLESAQSLRVFRACPSGAPSKASDLGAKRSHS